MSDKKHLVFDHMPASLAKIIAEQAKQHAKKTHQTQDPQKPVEDHKKKP